MTQPGLRGTEHRKSYYTLTSRVLKLHTAAIYVFLAGTGRSGNIVYSYGMGHDVPHQILYGGRSKAKQDRSEVGYPSGEVDVYLTLPYDVPQEQPHDVRNSPPSFCFRKLVTQKCVPLAISSTSLKESCRCQRLAVLR